MWSLENITESKVLLVLWKVHKKWGIITGNCYRVKSVMQTKVCVIKIKDIPKFIIIKFELFLESMMRIFTTQLNLLFMNGLRKTEEALVLSMG